MRQWLHPSQGIAARAAVVLLLTGLAACSPGTDPDLTNDGVVNILDVSLVGSCQGLDLNANPQCAAADTDRDGDVDQDDLDFVVAHFGETGFPFCGDNTRDLGERCDASDDAICPGRCQADCSCAPEDQCVAGESCDTGQPGVCAAGLTACPNGPTGAAICEATTPSSAEICDGLDNDCDGLVDEGDVCGPPCEANLPCDTGQLGVCAEGGTVCSAGPVVTQTCESLSGPGADICDGFDNDCDGDVDEGFGLGGACDTGDAGVCGPGTFACDEGGGVTCAADSGPQPEICNDGIDQDCDGSDCVLLSIDIETPSADLVTADDSVAVAGTFGAGVTSVAVSGVAATLGVGTFSATVPLRAGPNMLVAIARDSGGHTGTDSVVVTRDTIAPNVQINSPPSGFRAIVDRVTVTGIVNDIITGGIDPRVQVNGLEALVQQGTFMVMDVPLVRGPNTLVAIAVDSVGNQGSAEIPVSFDPPAGAKLEPVSGDGQASLVGTLLAEPLVVRIVDDAGNALASRVVRFEVLRSSGSLATDLGQNGRVVEVPSDGAGLARVSLTLGNRSGEGNNQVRASSVGASGEALFCATGQPALANKILAVMGENQKGQAGSPLPEPFEVLVVDVDGNPVAGVPITYSVTGGGGNFDGLPEKTLGVGADGIGRAVLTLGPAEGTNNNIVSVTFPDNPGSLATFISSALVAGPPEDTRFAGVVLDNTNTPIPDTTVHIEGSAGDVLTNAEGLFLVEGVPVGAIHLEFDPSTSTRPEIFPRLAFEATTVAGRINRLPIGPIRIPPLVSDAQIVGGAEDVVLQMPGVPGLTVTIFANSATFPDGSSVGLASVNQVHLDKVPMPPPSGTLFMPPAWTLQPPGVLFDPPAAVTIPNDGLPPGRVIDIFQFDHDLNRFVNIGPGTVDEEALLIVSDPGFGITKAGWGGCGQPQPPPTCASGCESCQKCVNGSCVADASKQGVACDDTNSCTKDTKCDAGSCIGGSTTMNTTGGMNVRRVWRELLAKCAKSPTMKEICKDPNIGMVTAKLGRTSGTFFDTQDSDRIDIDDLETVDMLRCSWSMDSCQAITHFMRERLVCLTIDCKQSDFFDEAHLDGMIAETAYRKEKGRPGEATSCVQETESPPTVVCTYDDDEDGTTDRTVLYELDRDDDITKVTCNPGT